MNIRERETPKGLCLPKVRFTRTSVSRMHAHFFDSNLSQTDHVLIIKILSTLMIANIAYFNFDDIFMSLFPSRQTCSQQIVLQLTCSFMESVKNLTTVGFYLRTSTYKDYCRFEQSLFLQSVSRKKCFTFSQNACYQLI